MARRRPLSAPVRRRRIIAVVVFLAAVAAAVVVSVLAIGRHARATPPPPPPPRPQRQFRIVFPEGFTRAQMGVRVQVVAKIAEHERHGLVRLDEAAYLAASGKAVVSCFSRRPQRNLEGFLFPATYDFVASTTSKQLVE